MYSWIYNISGHTGTTDLRFQLIFPLLPRSDVFFLRSSCRKRDDADFKSVTDVSSRSSLSSLFNSRPKIGWRPPMRKHAIPLRKCEFLSLSLPLSLPRPRLRFPCGDTVKVKLPTRSARKNRRTTTTRAFYYDRHYYYICFRR